MNLDRRWERLHANGWRSVVVQKDENWYTGYALPPATFKATPALQHHLFAACREAAEEKIPSHKCTCPDWREVLLPHELGSRQPIPTKGH
jgi:hypothetical protein